MATFGSQREKLREMNILEKAGGEWHLEATEFMDDALAREMVKVLKDDSTAPTALILTCTLCVYIMYCDLLYVIVVFGACVI